jgi:aspartate carbamoyltransferase catalytic subunit
MKTSLLDFDTIEIEAINEILNRASFFSQQIKENIDTSQYFKHKVLTNLFYEPSTRTQYSFDIAAKRLGLHTLNPNMTTLSDTKGESLLDTLSTFEQLGVDLFVMRHHENFTPHFIANEISTPIINAGDGNNHHPSQALIDIYTIMQKEPSLEKLKLGIVGDIKHSRVARSIISLFSKMGGQEINLICPPELAPEITPNNTTIYHELIDGIKNCDVVMTLRIQHERIKKANYLKKKDFYNNFLLTSETLKHTNRDTILLHPGPINRGTEIESLAADSKQSKIKQQVNNSIPVRMAIIEHILQS